MELELNIVTRKEWGTKYPELYKTNGVYPGPWGEVVFHTGAVDKYPQDFKAACRYMIDDEYYHVVKKKWRGIAYSFLIPPYGGDVFEGRGWLTHGAHTEYRNKTAHGIQFMGHGDEHEATKEQIQTARLLIAEGIRLETIKPNPLITGHFLYSGKGKTCPGTQIQRQLPLLRGVALSPVEIAKKKGMFDMFETKEQFYQAVREVPTHYDRNLAGDLSDSRVNADLARKFGEENQAKINKIMEHLGIVDEAAS